MIAIEPWSDPGQVPAITGLLHAAYAPLAKAGMRYFASHQSEDDTLARLSKGDAYLALEDGEIVGTVTLSPPGSLGQYCEIYGRTDVCVFHQFAVAPDRQRRGIGGQLLGKCEERAASWGRPSWPATRQRPRIT